MRTLARFLGPGPSPRAWGLLLETNIAFLVDRSIPTCVGTTRPWCPPVHMWTGHPHVRGDYGQALLAPYADAGPSPRAWGLRSPEEAARAWRRAIPTCVGTTGRATPVAKERPGPSPRAWGLRRSSGGWKGWARAIPTCVGTTRRGLWRTPTTSGHPHVRGDYSRPGGKKTPGCGPSPRAWGLPVGRRCRSFGLRAIPTCVGTTGRGFPRQGQDSGHPHVRGDYMGGAPGTVASAGPSPRAWGLRPPLPRDRAEAPGHPHVRGDYEAVLALPPGAFGPSPRAWGLRRCSARSPAKTPGHPHVRGDYEAAVDGNGVSIGPSPRAWGLPRRSPRPKGRTRAIPTCVGTTGSG